MCAFFRALEIERWQLELEKLLREVMNEIAVLNDAKEACERALEAKVIPTEVVTECISLREGNVNSSQPHKKT